MSDCNIQGFLLNFITQVPTEQRGSEKMLGSEERAVGWCQEIGAQVLNP